MDERQTRRILEKAVARGLASSAQAHESLRRWREAAARGEATRVVDLLLEITGLEPRLVLGLDDRSLIGRSLGGFEVLEKIGEGGVGSVFIARQTSLDRRVALKVLDPALVLQPGFAARFQCEARIAAQLEHPNVVAPIDFGDDAGWLFFAMEYMSGGSAAQRLAAGPLSEIEAIEIATAISSALEYAADEGMVHRDIKPDNILFSKHGAPKLGDLGLVLSRRDERALTEPGLAMGTPDYMAPEQARAERDLDIRTDIYALGVTLFELVTRQRPFVGPDALSVVTQHLTKPLPDPREHAPNLSGEFVALLERMTAKAREDRFASAGELSEALRGWGRTSLHAAAESPADDATENRDPSGPATFDDGRLGTPCDEQSDASPAPTPPLSAGSPAARGAGRWSARRVALLLAGILLVGGTAGGLLLPRLLAPRVDDTAEAAAARAIRDLLFSRRSTDGGYGFSFAAPADPWTTAQAAVGLATAQAPPPPGHLADQLRRLRRMAPAPTTARTATAPPAIAGWPVLLTDTAAVTEVTGWVAVAVAVAGERTGTWSQAAREEVRAYLLSVQTKAGGFPSIPAAGASSVRTTATVVGLIALVALDPGCSRRPDVDRAVARAAGWLGAQYDRTQHGWFANPIRDWGNRHAVPGLNEQTVWALLEAEALLAERDADLPAAALAAIEDYAEHHETQPLPLDQLGETKLEDYFFSLPQGEKTTFRAVRTVWVAWRLLATTRLGQRPATPRASRWRREAGRLRARLPELARLLPQAPTFQVAECAFAVNLIVGARRDQRLAGSLLSYVRSR